MFSLLPDLYAMSPQAGGAGGGGMMGQFALFGAIFVIFFFLVIRPQQKKVKQHKELVSSLQKGDQVITGSGIYGKINKYFDDKDYMLLEIAEKTIIKVQKSQVSDVVRAKAQKDIADDSKEKTDKKDKA